MLTIHMTQTVNRVVEIKESDLVDLMRVHQVADREEDQELADWIFEAAPMAVLTVLVGLSEIEDEDVEFDEIEDDEA